jgi:AAA domain
VKGVLIWLNGAFGAGKTSVAFEMRALHPNAVVFDPEEIGSGLRRAQHPSPHGDFQDDPLWRELVLISLERVLARASHAVIVPMTLVNALYFEEIIGELRARGHDVRHFALTASRESVLRRLRRRGDFADTFAHRNLERCLQALTHPRFDTHVPTDDVRVEAIARDLLERVGLDANANLEPSWARGLRRWCGWWQHIRLNS